MTHLVLRLLVVLAMLTTPVMASWRPASSTGDTGPALGLVLDESGAERCLRPPEAYAPCQACLAVLGDAASSAQVALPGSRLPPTVDASVGVPILPEPIPP